jgi:hypothetical protein
VRPSRRCAPSPASWPPGRRRGRWRRRTRPGPRRRTPGSAP